METKTITLNSKSNAKYPWPKHGLLFDPEDRGQCCIGQCMRQVLGVPEKNMKDYGLINEIDNYFDIEDDVSVLGLDIAEEVIEEISEILDKQINPPFSVEVLGAHINDCIACDKEQPDVAVEALRVLFRWAGEQVGERWVVRYLKDN